MLKRIKTWLNDLSISTKIMVYYLVLTSTAISGIHIYFPFILE